MKTDNELIAEFMGLKVTDYPIQYSDRVEHHYYMDGDDREIDLDYDTSWDWLMPVVEKIKKCGYDDRGFELLKTIDHYLVMVQIADVHMYVAEFIKWYNNQPKP
jgi:hypothetical protein